MTAAPIPPRTMAPHSMRRGHSPNRPDHNAVASGMTLMSATVAPELTQCSATATPPFPTTSSRNPMSAAPRHCLARGIGCPRIACQPSNSAPATTKRVPTRKNGAAPSIPTLIAKYVVPQMVQTASKPAAMSQPGGLGEFGDCLLGDTVQASVDFRSLVQSHDSATVAARLCMNKANAASLIYK